MGVACPKCGNEDLRLDPISRFRLGIPHLSDLQQANVVLSCQPCRSNFQFLMRRRNGPSFSHFMDIWDDGKPQKDGPRQGHITLWSDTGKLWSDTGNRKASVDYIFAHRDGQGVLWPMHECQWRRNSRPLWRQKSVPPGVTGQHRWPR